MSDTPTHDVVAAEARELLKSARPKSHDATVAEVRNILDSARPIKSKPHTVEPSAKSRRAIRRRHFALGLFLVAIFLVALSAILPEEDRLFWGGSSFLVLVVAAWQWDRAKRDIR